MKQDRTWIPGQEDLDYIEALCRPVDDVFLAIETDAERDRVPILDRSSGRVLEVLAAGRRRILEVGTAYGYSTLWMARGQGPAGELVTIDPDAERTARARSYWRAAGVDDRRIAIVNRPALEAFADPQAELEGPFDLVFLDALKAEYQAYLNALVPRIAVGALVLADNVLLSGRVSGARPAFESTASTEALRTFNASMLSDRRFTSVILPVGDGLLLSIYT